jgi:hypothetical protein
MRIHKTGSGSSIVKSLILHHADFKESNTNYMHDKIRGYQFDVVKLPSQFWEDFVYWLEVKDETTPKWFYVLEPCIIENNELIARIETYE